MKTMPLKVRVREEKGKSAAKKLRAQGMLPAVLYGEEIEPLPLAVDLKELKSVIHTDAGLNVILNLEVEGTEKGETAIIREIQKDSIKASFLHADFLKIALDEKIQAAVPVLVVGEAPGVKNGGVLQHGLWEVQVECLPADLPEHLEVDVSTLEIGDSLRISDLPRPEKVELLTHAEEMLVSILAPAKAEEVPAAAAEAVEPEVIGEAKEEKEAGTEGKVES